MAPPGPYSARVRRALAQQRRIAAGFSSAGFPADPPRFIGGADIAFAPAAGPGTPVRAGAVGSVGLAVAVVYDLLARRIVECRYARRRVGFPYVPGLLSFREEPILRAAIRRIRTPVDVWLFDGHGRAHPRGAGLATHMGVRLGLVSIGVAKALLVGAVARSGPHTHRRAAGPPVRGAPVRHRGVAVAEALWTQPAEDPIYVSCGHRVTLDQAVATVLACLGGHRLPEPTHTADALGRAVRHLPARAARRYVEAAAGQADRLSPAEKAPRLTHNLSARLYND